MAEKNWLRTLTMFSLLDLMMGVFLQTSSKLLLVKLILD